MPHISSTSHPGFVNTPASLVELATPPSAAMPPYWIVTDIRPGATSREYEDFFRPHLSTPNCPFDAIEHSIALGSALRQLDESHLLPVRHPTDLDASAVERYQSRCNDWSSETRSMRRVGLGPGRRSQPGLALRLSSILLPGSPVMPAEHSIAFLKHAVANLPEMKDLFSAFACFSPDGDPTTGHGTSFVVLHSRSNSRARPYRACSPFDFFYKIARYEPPVMLLQLGETHRMLTTVNLTEWRYGHHYLALQDFLFNFNSFGEFMSQRVALITHSVLNDVMSAAAFPHDPVQRAATRASLPALPRSVVLTPSDAQLMSPGLTPRHGPGGKPRDMSLFLPPHVVRNDTRLMQIAKALTHALDELATLAARRPAGEMLTMDQLDATSQTEAVLQKEWHAMEPRFDKVKCWARQVAIGHLVKRTILESSRFEPSLMLDDIRLCLLMLSLLQQQHASASQYFSAHMVMRKNVDAAGTADKPLTGFVLWDTQGKLTANTPFLDLNGLLYRLWGSRDHILLLDPNAPDQPISLRSWATRGEFSEWLLAYCSRHAPQTKIDICPADLTYAGATSVSTLPSSHDLRRYPHTPWV